MDSTVIKLKDGNYYFWKNAMMLVLQSKGYWKYALHETIWKYKESLILEAEAEAIKAEKDATSNDGSTTNTTTPTTTDPSKLIIKVKPKEIEKWFEEDQKCRAQIALAMDQKYQEIVNNNSTSFKLWKAIERVQANGGNMHKSDLMVELFAARIQESESLTSFLDRVLLIKSKIKALGDENINKAIETVVCYFVLGTLPEKHKQIKIACLLQPVTIDVLEKKISLSIHLLLKQQTK
jgi:hypothetical protein